MAIVKTAQFTQAAARALRDEKLRRHLDRVLAAINQARDEAIERLPEGEWDQMRERARSIRAEAIEHLDYYLDLADRSVRRNGGHVHFAQTAADANRVVLDIARQHNVRQVVKAQSSTIDELGLTAFLAQQGIAAVETDLGEYIVKLAGEPPFHPITPALHKSREEVSSLFTEHLNSARTTNPAELSAIARHTLREGFTAVDMGITGANFVVAETGTVVLVSNESSSGMSTTLPRVHVAIAGIDKVLPAMEDVTHMLRVLARSATGQGTMSYTTLVSGPRASSEEDGPDEVHLILVDNGRTKLLGDSGLREALYCIHCGACSDVCPVYQKVGGHAYGWVYSGPIGAVVTPVLTGLKAGKDLPFASTLCGACRDACPVKIDIPALLVRLRQKTVNGEPRTERSTGWFERLAARRWVDRVASQPGKPRASVFSRLLQKAFVTGQDSTRLPGPVMFGWEHGPFPRPASKSFHDLWKERSAGEESRL